MPQLAYVTLLVRDYDEAIHFYTRQLGFRLRTDTQLTSTKRWVLVEPAPGSGAGCALLLARASTAAQRRHLGRQTGGRVAFFLTTDDFKRDYALFKARGVRFQEEPRQEAYGTVAVFEDLYGNRWDLLQLK